MVLHRPVERVQLFTEHRFAVRGHDFDQVFQHRPETAHDLDAAGPDKRIPVTPGRTKSSQPGVG